MLPVISAKKIAEYIEIEASAPDGVSCYPTKYKGTLGVAFVMSDGLVPYKTFTPFTVSLWGKLVRLFQPACQVK